MRPLLDWCLGYILPSLARSVSCSLSRAVCVALGCALPLGCALSLARAHPRIFDFLFPSLSLFLPLSPLPSSWWRVMASTVWWCLEVIDVIQSTDRRDRVYSWYTRCCLHLRVCARRMRACAYKLAKDSATSRLKRLFRLLYGMPVGSRDSTACPPRHAVWIAQTHSNAKDTLTRKRLSGPSCMVSSCMSIIHESMTSMSMVSFCLVMHSMHAVYLRVIHEMDSMHACYLSNRPIHARLYSWGG